LKTDDVSVADIEEYLECESDFAFEMKVLNEFRKLRFIASHGGTYQDPITNKVREFDVRASYELGSFILSLAIECKNIRNNYPIVANLVKRTESESKIDYVHFVKDEAIGRLMSCSDKRTLTNVIYVKNDFVAKRIDQVGRNAKDEIVSGDSQVFEKLTQALNSSYDLVRSAAWKSDRSFSQVISPWLIIPDERLFGIAYNDDGTRNGAVHRLDACSWYVDKCWQTSSPLNLKYSISHIEIVSFSCIKRRVDDFLYAAKNAGLI